VELLGSHFAKQSPCPLHSKWPRQSSKPHLTVMRMSKVDFPKSEMWPVSFRSPPTNGGSFMSPPKGLFPSRNSHTPFRNQTFTSLKITRETTTRPPCCFRARGRCRERVHHGRPTAAAASSFQGRGETGSQTSQPHRCDFSGAS